MKTHQFFLERKFQNSFRVKQINKLWRLWVQQQKDHRQFSLETLVWTFIYQVNQVASFVEATENFLCWVNQQYLQHHHNFCLDQLVNITHVLANVLSMSWHHDDHHHHFQEWADYKLSWNPADYGENCWRLFSSLFIFDCSKNDCWLLIVDCLTKKNI